MAILILALKVNLAVLNEVIETLNFSLLDCVKYWSLAFVVNDIWITSPLNQFLHDFNMSLPGSIKESSLIVRVAVVHLAPVH